MTWRSWCWPTGERWREVALLAGAKAARGTISAAWNLAEALCCHTVGGRARLRAQYLAALLAAQTLIENAALAPGERAQPAQGGVHPGLAAGHRRAGRAVAGGSRRGRRCAGGHGR